MLTRIARWLRPFVDRHAPTPTSIPESVRPRTGKVPQVPQVRRL